MSDPLPLPALPARDPAGHKGTFGTVAVIGGYAGPGARMIGAPALAALGAIRAGCGVARLACPAPIINEAVALCPAATGVPIPADSAGLVIPHEAARIVDGLILACDCLVVGPGMGEGDGPRTAALRCVQQEQTPVVVDADALNRLAELPELFRDFHAAAVLTPHPGEYRRLAAMLRIERDPGAADQRPGAAEALAQRLGCIVVLKGRGTVVSDGLRTWTGTTGSSTLATGGTGDVLSGIIAGLIAQFAGAPGGAGRQAGGLDLFGAACLAVHAHGLAGERWAASRRASAGLLATELADELPAVLETLRSAPE